MKIAFTTSGTNLFAPLDSNFAHARKFLVYDVGSKRFEVIDNQYNLNAVQGAGIQSAETAVRLGVKCLVTGFCGPKAFRALSVAGIKIFNTYAPTVAKALILFLHGYLFEADSGDVERHCA
jgi:predicted Fe-Mo cluster-binding NifX family protein